MAYLAPIYAQDPRKQAALTQADPTTGGGAPADSGGGSSAAQTPGTAPDTGSGWTNLQDYLTPGNLASGKAMGDQALGKVAGDVKSAQDSLSQQAGAWQNTNQAAIQDAWNTAKAGTGAQASYDQQYEAAAKAAGDVAVSKLPDVAKLSPEYQQAIYNQAVAGYKATNKPQAAQGGYQTPDPTAWTPDLSGVTKAEGEANALASGQPGYQAYLKSNTGGNYTSGMAGLDAFLMGSATPGLQSQAKSYAQQAQSLENPASPALSGPIVSYLDPRSSQKKKLF